MSRKLFVLPLSSCLPIFLAASAAHAQVIDIDALNNAANNPVQHFYEPGAYRVVPISPVHGGGYTAWSAHLGGPDSWLHRYSVESTEFAYQEPGGTVGFSASEAESYGKAVSTTFTIATSAMVSFYTCDGPNCWQYSGDNQGGVSLFVAPALGNSFCVAAQNSSGNGATIYALGSDFTMDQDLTLVTEGVVPGVSGMYYFGTSQIQVPFGDGIRCVGGAIRRINPASMADSRGVMLQTVNGGQFGSFISAGSQLNFQLWYRDTAAGASGFNFSDAVSVLFQ